MIKLHTIIYLATLLLISCEVMNKHEGATKKISNEKLIGSWGSCLEDSLYVELHFFGEDYAFHLDGEILDYNVGKYKICDDKIYLSIQEEMISCDQKGLSFNVINSFSDNSFISLENNKNYLYKRLSRKPLMDYELGTVKLESLDYMLSFKSRKDTFNCKLQ